MKIEDEPRAHTRIYINANGDVQQQMHIVRTCTQTNNTDTIICVMWNMHAAAA